MTAPRRLRAPVALAVVIAVAGAGAAVVGLALRGGADREPRGEAARPFEPAVPSRGAGVPSPPSGEDPAASAARAEHEEARALFRSLRDAFAAGGSADRQAEIRLGAALGALWPRRPAWSVDCRGLVCRVGVQAETPEWRDALEHDAAVRGMVERRASDPDGEDPASYLLLTPHAPPPGYDADVLGELERDLLASQEARDCLAASGAPRRFELELRADPSGITYRSRTPVPRHVDDCLREAIADVIRLADVPGGGVRTASRMVALRP